MAELEINSNKELREKLDELIRDVSINKPTEEEVEAAKKEYEDAANKWASTVYKIGKPEEAQEICDYIKHFLMNRFLWYKEAWMGVIKLTEELNSAENVLRVQKDKGLELGYQALEFTLYAFSNPGGIGLQAALDFEQENELYSKILKELGDLIEGARKAVKGVEFLHQKWMAYTQGFYYEKEEITFKEEEPKNEEESLGNGEEPERTSEI
jgi:hypothetical protein